MSAQIFLTVDQILSLLMGELPDGVYSTDRADNPDVTKRSNSSAELRAIAQLFANLYSNLEQISADKSLSTVTQDGLNPWERQLFAAAQDSTLPYATRQAKLLAQYRANGGISQPAIESLIHTILDPLGLTFLVLPYSGQSAGPYPGAWVLDYSPLDLGTYLGDMAPLDGARIDSPFSPLDCSLDYAAAGITADQLASIQNTAYTYEVLIFGNADAQTLAELDQQLTEKEPARSTHVITNNAPTPFDPDAVDFGSGAGPIMDVFDFGSGDPAATYDVYDFGSA